MGKTWVEQWWETEKEQRKKRKGIGIHSTRGPLQLFSRGYAHGGLRATTASRMHLANFDTTQVGPTPQISAENFSFQQVRITFQKGAWSV